MNRKTLVLAAAIGLLAPVLAGCGDTEGGSGDGDAIVVGTTDRFTASKEKPAPVDPAYAYDVGTWNILRQTVQTLLIQPRGDGAPVPEAAESCGFTDSGNERYSCTLREGLKFSNGDALTAADVKYSIERALAIEADTGVFALLSTIDTIETQGDLEVIFHLKSADATFPYKLSTPVAGIVPEGSYAKDKLREGFDVDGSGPYTFETEVEDGTLTRATYVKNPSYKGSLKVGHDRIEMLSYESAEAMGEALESEEIDVMTRSMSPEQITALGNNSDDSVDLVESPGLEIRYLAFNTEAPSVKTKAVRQAMAQIINRSELVAKVYGSQAEPLYSLVPATVTGHSNAFFNTYGDPDVAKARQRLERAGVSTPVKMTLHYTTDHYGPATKAEFEQLSKQLNDSGLFDTDIEGAVWDTFRPDGQEGKFDVYGMGWFPDYPDADAFISPFLDEDNFLNSPYANAKIRKELIPDSRRQADRLAAAGSLNEIQNIVAEDVPVLPLWQGKQYVAANDDVTGTAYLLNSSSTLQLWELGRGVSG
ncbi:ABC transporter substrate-binding protein [Streptomyces prasinopilosus]|uniref:Peptide/nickel transport system substrate-binding protein n=1 Tax=Streptomyces prasinopilosus TaxID=67344 RepID=A0A1G6UH53_9ACTN|nr:ABC transporter substrate-binding protein [Streptomyces prasinopilosus]SDD40046.1 peptide/nickel transport system substrate-binding protein [Streptomyces prasinopilosus]